jgi:hypothetical protein
VAGAALLDRLRRSAGVPGDDGQAGRRRLQRRDAETLDVEAATAGTAGQGEHVAHGVMGRQFRRRDRTGEHDVLGHAGRTGEPAQAITVRAAADQEQPCSRHLLAHERQRPDQGVLSLARHEPGHAHHERCVAEAIAPAQLRTRGRIGTVLLGVDAGRQHLQRRPRPERARHPSAGVAGDRGEHVRVGADPAQGLPRARQHRPAHLVPVRTTHHAFDACLPAQVRAQQRERSGGAEPDRGATVLPRQRRGPPGDHGEREHERRRVPVHRVGQGGVELGRPSPGRRVDGDLARRQPVGEGPQVGLDAPGARREVVRHEQRARHRATLSP